MPGRYRHPRGSYFGARSLGAIILENKLYQNGASPPAHQIWMQAQFEALFNPHDLDWRGNGLADGPRVPEGSSVRKG